jgi:hypothetical protein
MQNFKSIVIAAALLLAAGCTPTVKVEAPDKPIEINLNVKIEQEVKIRIDKELDAAIAEDPELFGSSKDTKGH